MKKNKTQHRRGYTGWEDAEYVNTTQDYNGWGKKHMYVVCNVCEEKQAK